MAALERTILWFRTDLRLHDNPLLHHPAAQPRFGREVLYVYCADPALFSGSLKVTGLPKVGARRSRFLRQCVEDLRCGVRRLGGDLLVFASAAAAALPLLAAKKRKVTVVVTASVTPEEQAEEAKVGQALEELERRGDVAACALERVWGLTLYHVEDLPYRDVRAELPMTFAPFGRAVRGNFRAADVAAVQAAQRGEAGVAIRGELPTPRRLQPPPAELAALEDLEAAWPQAQACELLPADTAGGGWWEATFVGGESKGLERLQDFVERDLRRYKETRNGLVGLHYSSKLSPWVAAGCVSPRRAVAALREWEAKRGGTPTPSSAHWLSEFGWRDYLIYLAYKCGPSLFQLRGPGRVELEWRGDAEMRRRVMAGRTGMPLVDAAIREMAASGFMSNRARQFVASYLVVELQQDWRLGAELFECLLLDYDVHANWGNWMRAAGVDGQGFGHAGSRWFNLAEEQQRFDAAGNFLKLWLPELSAVPQRYLHAPWTMPAAEQRQARCIIGTDYPAPPETPSKLSLEGADPAALFPQLFATTREAKQGQRGRGKGSGRPPRSPGRTSSGAHAGADAPQASPSSAGRRWGRARPAN